MLSVEKARKAAIYLSALSAIALNTYPVSAWQEVAATEGAAPATAQAGPGTELETAPALVIPRGTIIRVRIDADVSSRTAIPDQFFPISAAEPVVVDGRILIPADATGQGQVVHARRSVSQGAGELIVAMRYLDVGGRRIALRGTITLDSSLANRATTSFAGTMLNPHQPRNEIMVQAGSVIEARTRNDEVLEQRQSEVGHE